MLAVPFAYGPANVLQWMLGCHDQYIWQDLPFEVVIFRIFYAAFVEHAL